MSTPADDERAPAAASDPAMVWSVGAVAERLGIAASTLRTWERRYAVGPTHRTAGGHRRYSETDIERVQLIQRLIGRGAPPMEAARVAHETHSSDLAAAIANADEVDSGADLDHDQVIEAIIRAAVAYDPARMGALVTGVLRRDGVVDAWSEVISPALIRIGEAWSAGNLGIESEHIATEVLVAELRAHTRSLGVLDKNGPTIVVASAEDDQHSLPLIALEAALAEAGLASHVLGSQFPADSLFTVSRTLRPTVAFVWASLPRAVDDHMCEVVSTIPPPTTVILGGPGWPHQIAARMRTPVSSSLGSTVQRITALVG